MKNAYKSATAGLCFFVIASAAAQTGSPTGICHYRTGGTGPCLPESGPGSQSVPDMDYGVFRQFGEALGKKLFEGPSSSNHALSVQFNKQGIELYNQKRYQEAVQAFTQSLQYEPGDAVVEGNLRQARAQTFNDNGIALLNAGNASAAVEQFEQALALWPDNGVMRQNLAIAKQTLSQNKDRDEGLALDRQGDAQLGAGNIAAAVDLYRRAFEKYPQQWIRKNLDNAQAMLAAERANAEQEQKAKDDALRSKLVAEPVVPHDLRDEKIEALLADRQAERQALQAADQQVADLSASGEQQVTLAFAKQHQTAAMERIVEDDTAIQEELEHERALRKHQQQVSANVKAPQAAKLDEILSKECPHPPIPEGNDTFFYQCNKQDRIATPYCLEKKDGWIREVACH